VGWRGLKLCHRHSDSLKLPIATMTAGKPCFFLGGNGHWRGQKQGLRPGMGAKLLNLLCVRDCSGYPFLLGWVVGWKKDMSGKPDPDWSGIVGWDKGHAQIRLMKIWYIP
jgi:hypothetical protein